MRKIKRILGILSSLVFVLSMVSLTAFATDLSEQTAALPAPAHSKSVTSNNDGTYTLNLNVTGKVESVASGKSADILLIVDKSDSMDYKIDNQSRMQKVRALVSRLAENVLTSGATNRMAMVTFSGSTERHDGKNAEKRKWNDASPVLDWTSSAATVTSTVNNLGTSGGTNWEAGFIAGQAKMTTARADAAKYVIFLSDGNPTYHYDEAGWTTGLGSSTSPDDVSEAIAAATQITGTTFYSVGIGGDVDNMNTLATSMNGTYKSGTTADALDQIFAEIESMIVRNYKGVTISDKLSVYADLMGKDGGAIDENAFTLSASKNGQSVPLPDGVTAAYNSDEKTVSWTFPQDYALEDGVTYTISFKIQPSQVAKGAYRENGWAYPEGMIGEADTGTTSAGQTGFFSNDTATVTYNGTSSPYAKPVIQVSMRPITELPKAGGNGVYGLLALGIAMMAFAATLLIIQKRNFDKTKLG